MAYMPTNLCKRYDKSEPGCCFTLFFNSTFTPPFKLPVLKIYFTTFSTISTLDYVALVSIRINSCSLSELYIRYTSNLKT